MPDPNELLGPGNPNNVTRKQLEEEAREAIEKLKNIPISKDAKEWQEMDNKFVEDTKKKLGEAVDLRFHGLKPKTQGENDYKGLETFPKPEYCSIVEMGSDEVTAVCPVTNQPDWYVVRIRYIPREVCIESKSLKLFLQSFRNKGLFAEKFASEILSEVVKAIQPTYCEVKVIQKPRGGVSIESCSSYTNTRTNPNEYSA